MYSTKDVVYVYDASFDGFLCCVYESVYSHEMPCEIITQDEERISLYETRYIITQPQRAVRVFDSLSLKICFEGQIVIESAFLSDLPDKELCLLRFILLAYAQGSRVMDMMAHPFVQPVLAAKARIAHEAHMYSGFLRFEDVNGALVATISPKSYVLPFMRDHFCERFANEKFLIFDEVHHAALIYENYTAKIVPLDSIKKPPASLEEKRYQGLWKQFYRSVSISARENPHTRITHCAKRFWPNMLELP